MSHFTCMVFVKDQGYTMEQAEEKVHELLAPYDENTEVEPYEDEVFDPQRIADERHACVTRHLDRGEVAESLRIKNLSDYEYVLQWPAYDEADNIRDKGEGTYAILSTYNPKSQWDWYVLGGRWEGQQLKSGEVRPWGQIKELDMEGARTIAGLDASRKYDEFEAATKGIEQAPVWDYVRNEMFPGDIDKAREFYNNHPWVQATRDKIGIFSNAHDVFFVNKGGRKAMIEDARANVGMPYAAVDPDGGWNSKGKMGWFGLSSDEDKEAWTTNYAKLFDSLKPDDWWFQMDLHI